MAESPASQVYSPQVLGDAVLLGSGLGPLTVMRQEYAAQARARAAAARLKQQQEEADARNAVPMSANGWLPHNEELRANVKASMEKVAKLYQNSSLSPYEKKMAAMQENNLLKQKEDRSNELKAKLDQTMATAKADSRYNQAAVEKSFNAALYSTDPASGAQKALPINEVDLSRLEQILPDAGNHNRDEILKRFIKDEADKENVRIGSAATPGGFGLSTTFDSNIFARDKHNRPLLNADGSSVIRDLPALLSRAQNDPFMVSLLRSDAKKAQDAAGATQMASYATLSPEQRAQMQALPSVEQQNQINLPTDLAPYGKTKTGLNETYRAPHYASAGAKRKANEGVATPTQGFTLDAPTNSEQVPVTTVNPATGGLGKFIHPSTTRLVTKQVPYATHYPTLGTNFSTSKNGFITLSASSNGITTLGSDGVASKLNATGSNSQVAFHANDRSHVLMLDGKRLSTEGDGTGKSAQIEQRAIVARLTDAEAKRLEYVPVYQGGVTDKSKTGGDGAGGTARIAGYKDSSGQILSEEMALTFQKQGIPVVPVYETTENLVKVIHNATPQMDAQAAAMTPGYNPRRVTPAEQDIINRVKARGGRVIDPYNPSSPASSPVPAAKTTAVKTPANATGSGYQRPAQSNAPKPAAAPKTAAAPLKSAAGASRGGSIYKSK